MLPIRVSVSAPLFPFDVGKNFSAEQYKIIRTKIVQHPRRPSLLLVSSAGPADGKSVTAINLAASLSLKTGGRVLLVDGDFRRASIHAQLGLPDSPGLTDVLAGETPLEEAIIQAEQFPNLFVLTAGRVRPNCVELLDSARWPALCATFRQEYGHVLFDSSPVAAVAEYHLLQAGVDGVLLVVRPDHTRRKLVFDALDFIPKDKLLGVVLNYVQDWFLGGPRSQHYGYYHSRSPRA
jgi:receptor protein-tyrosine kinase